MPVSKRRRRRASTASAEGPVRVRPRGVLRLLSHRRLFYVLGVGLMALSLAPFGLQGASTLHGGGTQGGSRGYVREARETPSPQPTRHPRAKPLKTYATPPPQLIALDRHYRATVRTERGDIVLEVDPALAPEAANSFLFLARDGFYDQGMVFHYVVPGFVAQTAWRLKSDGYRNRSDAS